MKSNTCDFLGSCLTLGLVAGLILGIAACSSKPATIAPLARSASPDTPFEFTVGSAQAFLASGTYSDGFRVDIHHR